MCSIEHQMTEIYCFIDDYLKAHPRRAGGWRRSPNSQPAFTDAEVLTIALLQEKALSVARRALKPICWWRANWSRACRIWLRTNNGWHS